MKLFKRKNIIPLCLASLFAAFAASVTADRIVTVYGQGAVLGTFSAAEVDSIAFGTTGTLFKLYNSSRYQLLLRSRSKVDSIVFSGEYDKSSYPEFNTTSLYHDMDVSYNEDSKVYSLSTTGGDPYIFTKTLTADLPSDSCVIAFEYRCPKGVSDLQVFFADPVSESNSARTSQIPATIGSEWATFRFNIKNYRELFGWGKKGDRLRLDFGSASGVDISIRHFRIRIMTDAEKEQLARADSLEKAKKTMAQNLTKYLSASYDSKITNVNVSFDTVTITGNCVGEGQFAVADVAPFEDVTETRKFEYTADIPTGEFTIKLPRKLKRSTLPSYDRAISKWAIVKVNEDGTHTLVSHARYADDVIAKYSAEKCEFKGKKGIAAGGGSKYIADFESLDVHSITQNIVLSTIISTTRGGGFTQPYYYGGRTYYINTGSVAGYDATLKAAQKKDIVVEAIILTPTGSGYTDPECTGGYYTMPNMTTALATNYYAASLDYLARRYSTGENGRIHHWIMHNEVDQGDTWTNMGSQPEMRFYDRYIKSMRLCYNIVRQYDQNASVLGSYTHTWYISSNEYSPRTMLEQNVQYSNAEGDFRWGIAYHPYPINLLRPEFWVNDRNYATFNNNAAYVTFYNPEVINAWILKKEHLYKDGTKRVLVFSEQGTNSPSYSETDLTKQAAGAAWIWKKLQKLDGIDAMQWHNWSDNRAEFGLRIGLRAYADGDYKDLDPKPVWYVWKAAGTENEDEVFAPYLKTIGISSWDGIVRTVK